MAEIEDAIGRMLDEKRLMAGPGPAIHNVERRYVGGWPDFQVDVRISDFVTAFGDWDALIAIGPEGEAKVRLLKRAIYPEGTGLWGCAICEQWHEVSVKSCPLVGHEVERVVVGPIYHDGEEVLYLAAHVAVGSYQHGVRDHGIAVWRAPKTSRITDLPWPSSKVETGVDPE